MPTIYVDDKKYEIQSGVNLLHACLGLGLDLPYFCWHPALHSVGACRQCAVKEFRDEKDNKGRLVMACMTEAKDGMRISIDDAEAKTFRKSVIEWLMLNHPHDCPVCDEGGECHLQDMTVMTGHSYRRSRFKKRTFLNQDLGPFVTHEMDRCIQCYRCVRFYRDYAGGRDFDVFASHRNVYFGRKENGTLASPFSGNLVEVCPTGVFTDKTLAQHYTRKWDLQTAPSVCVHCSLGCNTIPGERYGKLRRTRNRYNGAVNDYFLCDRGRYGYGFVNSPARIRNAVIEGNPDSMSNAVSRAAQAIGPAKGMIGLGSPRASLESNFALREFVGKENFHAGISDNEWTLTCLALAIARGPARMVSLREAQSCDAVLVLGEDIENTAPVLSLNIRQSARNKPMERARELKIPSWDANAVKEVIQDRKGPLFIAAPYITALNDFAARSFTAAPAEIARLGFAVANMLDTSAPLVEGLAPETRKLAQEIAAALKSAARPLIISGINQGDKHVLQAAAQAAAALKTAAGKGEIALVFPECNSAGLAMLSPAPLSEAMGKLKAGRADTLIIIENDLYARQTRDRVDEMLSAARCVILIDHVKTATAAKSGYVLPAATYAESSGTYVNNEFRAQRFFQVKAPGEESLDSWRWLLVMGREAGIPIPGEWNGIDDVIAAISAGVPSLAGIREAAPPADFREAGMKVPRQPYGYSGRTAMHADRMIVEPPPPPDPDSPLNFSMEGWPNQPPPSLVPRFWAPGWNSIQSVNKFQQEIGGPLRGGHPGMRLIEPGTGVFDYFRDLPEPFTRKKRELFLLPRYHVFGSEELSSMSPRIAELVPDSAMELSPEDAGMLGIAEGNQIETAWRAYRARLNPEVPSGTALVSVLKGEAGGLPCPAAIKKRGAG